MTDQQMQIVNKIVSFMGQRGGSMRSWYVGISADARDRLVVGHHVPENSDSWICCQARTAADARWIEWHLQTNIGTQGGPGGGDGTTNQVYAYRMSNDTS